MNIIDNRLLQNLFTLKTLLIYIHKYNIALKALSNNQIHYYQNDEIQSFQFQTIRTPAMAMVAMKRGEKM